MTDRSTIDDSPDVDRRQRRKDAKRDTIVAEAWDLARRDGLAGISLRDLADRVDLRQPSLYAYFDSKLALYDAMFADGNRQLWERLEALDLPEEPRAALKVTVRSYIDFVLEDSARLLLLFQRPIPGFEPSPEAFAHAERVLGHVVDRVRAAGIEDPGDVDCFTAMVGGLVAAQSGNDPGGDRWTRHLDRLIDLHLDDANRRAKR